MLSDALKFARRPAIVRRSLLTSLVVGSILTVINQGDFMMDGSFNLLKCILTFVVPYCVATFGAVTALMDKPG